MIETIAKVKRNTLFLIRGLPGSGKTTTAQMLGWALNHCDVYLIAADDYMVNASGEYHFDGSKLKECHRLCQKKTVECMCDDFQVVIVHNTFTMLWEMEFYKNIAHVLGWDVKVIRCHGKWQNTHGVPQETIDAMTIRFENCPDEIHYTEA